MIRCDVTHVRYDKTGASIRLSKLFTMPKGVTKKQQGNIVTVTLPETTFSHLFKANGLSITLEITVSDTFKTTTYRGVQQILDITHEQITGTVKVTVFPNGNVSACLEAKITES